MYSKRPTHKEVSSRIRTAKSAVADKKIAIKNPESIASDAIELDYLVSDLPKILNTILDEITPNAYAGSRPPQQSSSGEITGSELFAFRWPSPSFDNKEIYLKFSTKDDIFWLVSLHLHRK